MQEQSICGPTTVLILGIAIVSYAIFADTALPPALPVLPGISVQAMKINIIPRYSDHFDIQFRKEFFLVTLPKPGVYLVSCTTEMEDVFHIVTQVKSHSTLRVELQSDARVIEASIVEGEPTKLAATSPEIRFFGSAIIFYTTGGIGSWRDYFSNDSFNTDPIYRANSANR